MRSNHHHNDVTKTFSTYFVGCGSLYLHSTFTRWQLLHFGRCSSHFCLRSRQLSQAFLYSSGQFRNTIKSGGFRSRYGDIDMTDSISRCFLKAGLPELQLFLGCAQGQRWEQFHSSLNPAPWSHKTLSQER